MKTYLALAAALTSSVLAMAAPAQIPEPFHGNWAASQADCAIPAESPIDFPDSGIKITAEGIQQYEADCSINKIISQTSNSLTAEFECGDTEGMEVTEKTLTLSAAGNELTGFDEQTLVRCK